MENIRYMIYVSEDDSRGFISRLFYDPNIASQLESAFGPVNGLFVPSQYLLNEGKSYHGVNVFLATISENNALNDKEFNKLREKFEKEGRQFKVFRLDELL